MVVLKAVLWANRYPEKAVNLAVSKLLQQELVERGATVYMTREEDKDVSLQDRVAMIDKLNLRSQFPFITIPYPITVMLRRLRELAPFGTTPKLTALPYFCTTIW
jgi:hypothetical protein